MRSQVLTGIGEMEMREVEKPSIKNDDDVLLKVEVVGVCGSDVHYYETGRIGSLVVEYPFRVGHEFTGCVEEVGGAVDGLNVGDIVVVEPAIVCGRCDQCMIGRENTCRQLKFLGCPGQLEGCLCEYIVMPGECCFPVGESVGVERGVLCEPFAIGVYAVEQAGMKAGEKIAILGAGPIGLSCLAAAKAVGVDDIYVTDKVNERVEVARGAGAVWSGNPDREDIVESVMKQEGLGMDVVFECAGEQEAIDQAVKLLRPGGKLMLIGIPRVERVSFVISEMRRKEITIENVRRQNECTQKAIDLISSGKVNLDFMMTHRFTLEDSKEAFDLVAGYKDGVVKALIKV
jgi:L-iditol 2-dehydrogenase